MANFKVKESNGHYHIEFKSDDGTFLSITAQETTEWTKLSVFEDQDCASDFFKQGSVGYSPNKIGETFDGFELKTKKWEVSPLTVSQVTSSFFEDKTVFPDGAITFDNALLMRNIDHEWNSKKSLENKTEPTR